MKKLFFLIATVLMTLSVSALTYTVKVPTGTKTCYIVGEMNNWKHQIMKQTDVNLYTIDLPNASINQKYKYCSGPTWGYVEKNAKGEEIDNRTYSESDVVESWIAVYDESQNIEYLDFNVTVPAGTKCCYINGGWDGWSTYKEMKKVDATHYTIKLLTDKQMKYNYYAGPGPGYVEIKEGDMMPVDRNYTPNDAVSTFVAYYDKSVPDAEISYTVTVPEGTNSCFIGGGWDAWSKLLEMKKKDATHFAITFKSNKALKYMFFSGPDMKYHETNPDSNFKFPRSYNSQDVVVSWKEVWQPK